MKRACRWSTYAIGWRAMSDGADRIRHPLFSPWRSLTGLNSLLSMWSPLQPGECSHERS